MMLGWEETPGKAIDFFPLSFSIEPSWFPPIVYPNHTLGWDGGPWGSHKGKTYWVFSISSWGWGYLISFPHCPMPLHPHEVPHEGRQWGKIDESFSPHLHPWDNGFSPFSHDGFYFVGGWGDGGEGTMKKNHSLMRVERWGLLEKFIEFSPLSPLVGWRETMVKNIPEFRDFPFFPHGWWGGQCENLSHEGGEGDYG